MASGSKSGQIKAIIARITHMIYLATMGFITTIRGLLLLSAGMILLSSNNILAVKSAGIAIAIDLIMRLLQHHTEEAAMRQAKKAQVMNAVAEAATTMIEWHTYFHKALLNDRIELMESTEGTTPPAKDIH